MPQPNVTRATPVLVAPSVEPCAKFWEQLGFTRSAEVPHGDTLGFVILTRNTIELMYQSTESVKADAASMGMHVTTGGTALFVEVEDLAAAAAAVQDAPRVLAERETFYGTREIGVLDPGGNFIILAQRIG